MARILKDYPAVALRLEELDGKLDFARIFGRTAPLHVEIGSGKAAFLLNQAKTDTTADFLGIEWAGKYYRHAVDRIGRWALTNVRIVRAEAAHFLENYVPEQSVDCFHIYFPDPWPKRRHHRRRFLYPRNLDMLIRLLKPAGAIRIATDHAEYFQYITDLLGAEAARLTTTDFLPAAGASLGEWVGSNFERKYRKQQKPIFTVAVSRHAERSEVSGGRL